MPFFAIGHYHNELGSETIMNTDTRSLMSEYRRAALASDELVDAPRQNRSADTVHACYKLLRGTEEGRIALIELMSDPSPHVRAWAAAHSLEWSPVIAKKVLETLRDEDVFPYSFDAKMTLQEFEKGTLSFDY